MLAKGEILQERYRILCQLGHGGMGAVYEAWDERLGSKVALKEIHVELDNLSNPGQQQIFRRAFEREAKLLANLHHDAFPRVTDYFSEAEKQFLIMELITGKDLGEQLSKNQTVFLLENVLEWADQLLHALDYLHTQNPPIFHRDIKPQNLKVTSRGKIKLLDFGIAKSADTSASTITNQTFIGATLNYSPIEQALPALPETFREFIILKHSEKVSIVLNQNTDARCDLYAIGATIYHLLTNQIPMDSAKRSLEIWEGNSDPLPNPSQFIPEIPRMISEWLLKAMQIDRENRFSSAIEMQKTLQLINTNQKTKYRAAGDVKSVWKNELMTETLPPLNSSTLNEGFATERSDIMLSATESNFGKIFNTMPSGSIFQAERMETVPYDKNLFEEKKSQSVTVLAKAKEFASYNKPNSQPKIFRTISIAAFCILAAGGMSGVFWLNSSHWTISTNSNLNPTVSTSTPIVKPSAESTLVPTISPDASPMPSLTPNKPKDSPTVKTIPYKTPVQNQVQTPQPQRHQKQKSDDCIYNGKCG